MNEEFRKLNIIFLALLAGQLIFLLVIFFIAKPEYHPDLLFRVLAPLAAMTLMVAGFKIYHKKVAQIEARRLRSEDFKVLDSMEEPSDKDEALERFNEYKTLSLQRMMMVEAANLIIIVFFLITGDYLLILYVFLGLLVFALTRPSALQFGRDFQVSMEEGRSFDRD